MNDWKDQLIGIYLLICEEFERGLYYQSERMSNNNEPEFSDEEVLSVYLFGLLQGHQQVSRIRNYCQNHLAEWFPKLPGYVAFTNRLNRLSAAISGLLESLERRLPGPRDRSFVSRLVDSMPVILARGGRADQAKVARELAQKSYSASKDLWYYGLKLHLVARKQPNSLALPEIVVLTGAHQHDSRAFVQMLPHLSGCDVFADKAYWMFLFNPVLIRRQRTTVYASIQAHKGHRLDYGEQAYNTMVSRVRQPIESFFNWLQQKTGIENASKVRSTRGLLVHVFGRLAAAFLCIILNS
jgi:hypothetical protein